MQVATALDMIAAAEARLGPLRRQLLGAALYTRRHPRQELLILAGSRRALAQAVRTRSAGRRHIALTHRLNTAG